MSSLKVFKVPLKEPAEILLYFIIASHRDYLSGNIQPVDGIDINNMSDNYMSFCPTVTERVPDNVIVIQIKTTYLSPYTVSLAAYGAAKAYADAYPAKSYDDFVELLFSEILDVIDTFILRGMLTKLGIRSESQFKLKMEESPSLRRRKKAESRASGLATLPLLRNQLSLAVRQEDYAQAAILRDKIKSLEEGTTVKA